MDPNIQTYDDYLGDDFDLTPQESQQSRFGTLTLYLTRIGFETGHEGYGVPGVVDFDGNPRKFKGKVPSKNGKALHLVMVLEQAKQDGELYTRSFDILTGDKSYKRFVFPALVSALGGESSVKAAITGRKALPVRIEEVPTGVPYSFTNREGEKQTGERIAWAVREVYASPEAMRDAAETYFAQFKNEGETDAEVAAIYGFPIPPAWAGDPKAWITTMPTVVQQVRANLNGGAPTPASLATAFQKVADMQGADVESVEWVWNNQTTLPPPV